MDDHAAERARDVPASCSCEWRWVAWLERFLRVAKRGGCPWHAPASAVPPPATERAYAWHQRRGVPAGPDDRRAHAGQVARRRYWAWLELAADRRQLRNLNLHRYGDSHGEPSEEAGNRF